MKYLTALAVTLTLAACGGGSEPRSWLDAVNDVRAAGACGYASTGAVAEHPALTASSQGHAQFLAEQGTASHIGRGGSISADRARAAGYPGNAGENVAAGQGTLEEALAGWLQSPAHCANLMSPRLTHMGLGYAAGKPPYGHYWVLGVGE